MTGLKQAIIVDTGLGMSTGKTVAQACHASLNAFLSADSESREEWRAQGAKKIVLKKGEKDFAEFLAEAERLNIPHDKVMDAGLTEVSPGTETAVCLGPAEESKIDRITSELELVE